MQTSLCTFWTAGEKHIWEEVSSTGKSIVGENVFQSVIFHCMVMSAEHSWGGSTWALVCPVQNKSYRWTSICQVILYHSSLEKVTQSNWRLCPATQTADEVFSVLPGQAFSGEAFSADTR